MGSQEFFGGSHPVDFLEAVFPVEYSGHGIYFISCPDRHWYFPCGNRRGERAAPGRRLQADRVGEKNRKKKQLTGELSCAKLYEYEIQPIFRTLETPTGS